jgi:hypothetical protein
MPAGWIVLVVSLWLAVVVMAITVAGLLHRLARLEGALRLRARPGAPRSDGLVGRVAPPRVRELLPDAGSGAIFLFMHSSCAPCLSLAEELEHRATRRPAEGVGLPVVVVCDPPGMETFSALAGLARMVVDGEGSGGLAAELGITATPSALVVDRQGVIRSAGVTGSVQTLERWAREVSESSAEAPLRILSASASAPGAGHTEPADGGR